jgi:hypothetical protein
MKMIENSFFNIFCYNEYVKDIYHTNKIKHFELILLSHGFVLSEEGKPKILNRETKDEMTTLVDKHNEDLFKEYLTAEDKTLVKFDMFNKNVEVLGLPINNVDLLEKYKDQIMDKYKLNEHMDIIRLLKSDEYIDQKINNAIENGFDLKLPSNIYNKIKLLRVIETTYNIKPLDVDFKNEGDITMTDEVFTLFKTLFRTQKKKPNNYKELKKLYVGIIKSITCNDIITSKRNKKRTGGNRDENDYKLDVDFIKLHLELNKYKNKNMTGFSTVFIDMFNIDVAPMQEQDANFIDYGLDM